VTDVAKKKGTYYKFRKTDNAEMFFGTREKILAEKLSPGNKLKFLSMSREGRWNVIAKMIEKGAMI